ncbi:hypothetical protein PCANB_000015 [Pneumocystis canis]|nr:hypothetical protein PCANB_000015 [Pneumocystis canis]
MFLKKWIRKYHLNPTITFQYHFFREKSTLSLKNCSKKSFIRHVQALEQYVAKLRIKLERNNKQKALNESELDRKSIENEHSLFYKSICDLYNETSTPAIEKAVLPSIIYKTVKNVPQEVFLDATWTQKMNIIDSHNGFSGLTTSQVNQIIALIASKERGSIVGIILDMIKKASIQPDRLTYDFMMDGYAEIGNAEGAMRIFSQMKQDGIKPSVFSYAHLMKAYSKIGSIDNVLSIFKDMEKCSIEPNLTIYTILISTFIQNKLFSNAWMVFELLKYRSKDVFPDVKTYSLMIHACALTGEAERANNLFQEMLSQPDGPLTPTLETYNALMHAFATRKDYFYEAWKIAKIMLDNNIMMDRKTLNTLLKGCGKAGDLKKARILAKFIFQKSESLNSVDVCTFQGLFRAYANYIPNNQVSIFKIKGSTDNKYDADILISKLNTNLSDTVNNTFYEHITSNVFLKSNLYTSKDVLNESKALMTYIQKNKYSFLDVQLMNAYLAVLINHGSYFMFKDIYENMYYFITAKDQEKLTDSYLNKFERGPHTYQLGLDAAYKFNDINFARIVWQERNHWRRLIENERKKSKKMETKFTEKYLDELDFNVCRVMINILAKNNLLEEARQLLISHKTLIPWEIKHLKPLWSKIGQIKDMEFKSLILKIVKSEQN